MKRYSQVPPVLFTRAIGLFLRRRVHFQKEVIGDTIREKEEFIIFRKVDVDPGNNQPLKPKALFRVYFCFAKFSPNVNRILSLIPIPFIIAQPGFRSKIWMTGKESGHAVFAKSIADDGTGCFQGISALPVTRTDMNADLIYSLCRIIRSEPAATDIFIGR